MKPILFTLSLFFMATIAQAQVSYISSGSPDLLIGSRVEITVRTSNTDALAILREKKFDLMVGKTAVPQTNYVVTEMSSSGTPPETQFKIGFDCPNEIDLPGKDRKIIIRKGTTEYTLLANIYASAPSMKEFRSTQTQNTGTNIFYNDNPDLQDIIIRVDNAALVKKVKFTDPKVQLIGAGNAQEIDCSNPDYKVDATNNLIILKARLLNVGSLNFMMTYIDKATYTEKETPTQQPGPPEVSLQQKFAGSYMVATPKRLYADDLLDPSMRPPIQLNMDDQGSDNKQYTFKVVGPAPQTTAVNVIVGTTASNLATFKKGQFINIYLPDLLAAGEYVLTATAVGAPVLSSSLTILPEPKITAAAVINGTNNEMIRKDKNHYTISVRASRLEAMEDVRIELFSKDPAVSQKYTLTRDPGFMKDAVYSTITFDMTDAKLMPVSQYGIRLMRPFNSGYTKEYDSEFTVSVVAPKLVSVEQTDTVDVALTNAVYAKKRDLRKPQYADPYRRILIPESPIIVTIKPSSEIRAKGQQYLNIHAVYHKSNGDESTIDWSEGQSKSLLVDDHPVSFNIRKAFNLTDNQPLGVDEKIMVTISHAPDIYANSSEDIPHTYTYYREMKFGDRFGITAAVPPYLLVGRKVARKTPIKDAQGNVTDMQYTGEKYFEAQSLVINAGIGFKYRFKRDNYENSKFALSAYLMGLNFAAQKGNSDQVNDPDNYNIIGNGTFNALFLGEYSLANLDALNARIPVYFGSAFIFKPLDQGPKTAYVLGLGIDIKIGH